MYKRHVLIKFMFLWPLSLDVIYKYNFILYPVSIIKLDILKQVIINIFFNKIDMIK